jgi:hypothetical protein
MTTAPVGCLDEREEFEAWVLTQPGGTEYAIRRRDMAGSELLGSYVEPAVDFAWQALCARSASRQEGWQTIETAPKDGTHILVSWPMRQMDDEDMPTGPITRRDTLVTWMNGDAWIEPDYLNASGAWYGDEDCYAADPDLWMPIPAAPQQSQEAQGDRHGE